MELSYKYRIFAVQILIKSQYMRISEKLGAIQQEIKIPKKQKNKFGGYMFRSAEDILEGLKPYEKKHKVTFTLDEELLSIDSLEEPIIYIVSYATIIDNESKEKIISRGTAIIDLNAKGMQKPQQTGSASSYAKKYALGNLLLLDDTKDSDAVNDHGGKTSSGQAPKTPPKPSNKLKTMGDAAKESLLKGISEGKFAQVEGYLSKYANDSNKKAVVAELEKARSGK